MAKSLDLELTSDLACSPLCRLPPCEHMPLRMRGFVHVPRASVSVSVETRRSDDLYTGASPEGDGVEAER